MSTSTIKIRRKSDGKVFTDVINDACQVHSIHDGDVCVGSFNEWEIGYTEWNGFATDSEYEEIIDENDTRHDTV